MTSSLVGSEMCIRDRFLGAKVSTIGGKVSITGGKVIIIGGEAICTGGKRYYYFWEGHYCRRE
eukprot:9954967-Prorocentrum_lima.AAC.1